MRVEIRVQITGLRDGQPWPAPGQVVDLPDAEAVDMLAAGLVAPLPEPVKVESADAPTKPTRRTRKV